jgi:hypothetical protein
MHYFTAIVVQIIVNRSHHKETNFSVCFQHKNTTLTRDLHWTVLWFSDFCYINGSPDWRDVQTGLTDSMFYQRHVGGSLYFLYVVSGSICKNFASFQRILWPSSYTCWIHFDFSTEPFARFYLCSSMPTSNGLPQSHGLLYTHCFVCSASLTGPSFISASRNVCVVLKMVLTLKRFQMGQNFLEIWIGNRFIVKYVILGSFTNTILLRCKNVGMGQKNNAWRVLVRKLEEWRPSRKT